jgi:hypothetical protein
MAIVKRKETIQIQRQRECFAFIKNLTFIFPVLYFELDLFTSNKRRSIALFQFSHFHYTKSDFLKEASFSARDPIFPTGIDNFLVVLIYRVKRSDC